MERFQDPSPLVAERPDPPDSGRAPGVLAGLAATIGVLVASPLLLGLTRDGTWYALPLLAGMGILWATCGLGRADVGFRRGKGFYARATLLPLASVGAAVWLATLLGVSRVGEVPLRLLVLQVSTMAALSALGTLVTEDGFFRGALWGVLERAGRSTDAILLWTASAYALWYVPMLAFSPSLVAGPEAIAVHALNLWLLGLSWGILRLITGSVLVVAWAHGLWNGLAYTLFGFGAAGGAMNVVDPLRYGPERGWAGVAINATALLVLWRWRRRHELDARSEEPAEDDAVGATAAAATAPNPATPTDEGSGVRTPDRGPDR